MSVCLKRFARKVVFSAPFKGRRLKFLGIKYVNILDISIEFCLMVEVLDLPESQVLSQLGHFNTQLLTYAYHSNCFYISKKNRVHSGSNSINTFFFQISIQAAQFEFQKSKLVFCFPFTMTRQKYGSIIRKYLFNDWAEIQVQFTQKAQ